MLLDASPLHLLLAKELADGSREACPSPSGWTLACCSISRLILFLLFPSHTWSCSATHQC